MPPLGNASCFSPLHRNVPSSFLANIFSAVLLYIANVYIIVDVNSLPITWDQPIFHLFMYNSLRKLNYILKVYCHITSLLYKNLEQ